MTAQERDYEAVLSRVLHSATDQVEPVGDGLTKIRARLTEPWLKRQWLLLRSEFVVLGWLVVVRCEAFFSRVRAGSDTTAGAGEPGTGHGKRPRRLAPVLAGLTAWASSRGPGRGSPESSRRSLGPVFGWLRPALAVAGAVVLVVVGVFALGGIRGGFAGIGASGSGGNNQGGSSQYGGNGNPNGGAGRAGHGRIGGSGSGLGALGQHGTHHPGATPSAAPCATPTPSPSSQAPSPTPSPSTSPTTSPTTSPSPTPTATPTPSGSASPNSFYQSPQQFVRPAGTTALVCGGGGASPGPSPSNPGMAD
jgi:hypothetical protein